MALIFLLLQHFYRKIFCFHVSTFSKNILQFKTVDTFLLLWGDVQILNTFSWLLRSFPQFLSSWWVHMKKASFYNFWVFRENFFDLFQERTFVSDDLNNCFDYIVIFYIYLVFIWYMICSSWHFLQMRNCNSFWITVYFKISWFWYPARHYCLRNEWVKKVLEEGSFGFIDFVLNSSLLLQLIVWIIRLA